MCKSKWLSFAMLVAILALLSKTGNLAIAQDKHALPAVAEDKSARALQEPSSEKDENSPKLSVQKVGEGVSAPVVTDAPKPKYSKKARQAKYQGTVVLWLTVGTDGQPHDIRVQRSLGLGLDEEAIKAVKKWKFRPAMKDGNPVAVNIAIEVNFRLQ